VFDKKWFEDEDVHDLKTPKDLQDIMKVITSLKNGNSNTLSLGTKVEVGLTPPRDLLNEENARDWFIRCMDIPNFPLPAPHLKMNKLQWKALLDSQIKTWKPNPDFVEGIIRRILPK